MDPTPAPVVLVDWSPGFAAMAQTAEDMVRLALQLGIVAAGLMIALQVAILIAQVRR